MDDNTFIQENKKIGGKYHTTARVVVSKDAKTLTVTSKGTDAEGKPIAFTVVYDKH